MRLRAGRPSIEHALAALVLAACTAPSPSPRAQPATPVGPHLIVLGVAQDAGHPQAGCTRSCCTSVRDGTRPGHRVVSLGLVDGDARLLFEATPDLPSQLGELSPQGTLHGIFLTHAHIGHYAGLVHLGREAMGARDVPVWAMPRMRSFLQHDRPWSLLVEQGHVQLRPLEDQTSVQATDSVRVTPFLVPHRDEISETVGYRIEGPTRSVAFLPDIDKWERWQTPVEELIRSVDVALVEATFYANGEIPRDMALIPHPFVQESMTRFATLPQSERAKVVFIHFNHTNPLLDPQSPTVATVEAAGFRVAREGQAFAL